jgi:cytochrome d ubiquinol oxidase subunit II
MDLNSLWFILIGVLYTGFFVLEGFDFGVGVLLPILGKTDTQRRVILNTVGPHWDGNEVWLLTAGGATFAAFPHWYATLFSGFYLPLFLLLVALIARGVAFEYRSKDANPRWRAAFDACITVGSLVPALLLGVAFANLVRGVPIDAGMNYVGGFFNLLNPYALLGGLMTVLAFALYGALFLSLKTTGDLAERARRLAGRLWLPAVIVAAAFAGYSYLETDLLEKVGVNPGIVPLARIATLLVAGYFIQRRRPGWAFGMMALTIVFTLISLFTLLFPRVMVSSLDPAFSLTIYNASSSPYTLQVMTVVAVIFVPVVLLYQGWTYWVFRHRIQDKPEGLTY